MAYKERINPKTGRKEYKVRYYFKADGKRKIVKQHGLRVWNMLKEKQRN